MPNYCYNEITLHGDTIAKRNILDCFAGLSGNYAERPAFIKGDGGLFYDLSIEDGERICYRTQWGPNIETIAEMAEYFGVDYSHYYIEPLQEICGEMSRRDGKLTHIGLVNDDLGLILYDPLCEQFHFKDQFANHEFALWQGMLQEKKMLASGEVALRRLNGELPRIDLGGTDFIFDWELKELRQANDHLNRIPTDSLMLNNDGDGYICFFDRHSRKVVEPRDLSALSAEVCLLDIPNEFELDPVALARENDLEDTDLLLAYRYQEHRRAGVTEVAELIRQQTAYRNSR